MIDRIPSSLYDKKWKMELKRILYPISLLLFCAFFLSSQSLVDVAKKEKERRANLKGKKSIVVTNDILKKKKIEPAILVQGQESPDMEIPTVSRMPSRRSLDNISPQAPSDKDQTSFYDVKNLEERWERANEYVALLTLKMNALWQEFYSMDDMTPRDHIQRQISETHLKLQKAQKDADQAKKELEEARQKGKK
jgi:hypothetical protein